MLPLRYLPDAPRFRSAGLSVRGMGIREAMPASFIERPGGTGDYLFMLFYDAVALGPGRRPLPPDTMVMWDRSAPHHYGRPGGRWVHSWVHCDGPDVAAIRRAAGVRGDAVVRLADPSPVDRHLLDVHAEISRGRRADGTIVRNLIENLVRTAARGDERPAGGRPPVPPGVAAVRVHLDTHYDRPTTLDALARLAGLSPRHFCTEFRRHVGVAPMAYLAHRRLAAAAALLRGTTEPVGEVGRRVGFPDPYHFSKRFKARYGVSPTRLRRPVEPTRP